MLLLNQTLNYLLSDTVYPSRSGTSKRVGSGATLVMNSVVSSVLTCVPSDVGISIRMYIVKLVSSSRQISPVVVRSKYSADRQVSIVQQVVTVTTNRSQALVEPQCFPPLRLST